MSDRAVDVSFVVPAKNEEHNIVPCVESLLACERAGLVVEICVVDNGSSDATVALARGLGVRVLAHHGPSISALRNFGASATRGTWIAFVDADVTIERDWLENAVREIRAPDVGAVGSSPAIPAGSNWIVRTWHLQIGIRPDYCEREWLASMNMLVSREAFERVGGFDEALVTCEDVDLGYRLGESHRIVYDKRIRAVHHGEAQTLAQLFRKEAWRGSYNYRGLLRHGWRAGELPSLVQPILTSVGLLCIVAGAARATPAVALTGLAAFAAFPLAKTLQTLLRTGAWSASPALLLIWSIYSLARVWSALLETRRLLFRRSDRTSPDP